MVSPRRSTAFLFLLLVSWSSSRQHSVAALIIYPNYSLRGKPTRTGPRNNNNLFTSCQQQRSIIPSKSKPPPPPPLLLLLLTKKNQEQEEEGDNDNEQSSTTTNNKKQDTASFSISFIEGAVKSLTGDDSYQFGDYSKKALTDTTSALSQAGKVVTGNDKYVFGDITKGYLNDMESALDEWKDKEFNDLAKEAFQQVFGNMNRTERQALLLSTIRILAIALLSWGCVANLCTSLTVTLSWTKASLDAAVRGCWNPFRSNALQRQVFWTTYSYARLLLDPFYLVVQGAATLFLLGRYQRFVSNIEQKWITKALRNKYPLLYRVAALFLAFVCNLAVAGLVTLCGVGFGTILGQWKLNWIASYRIVTK
jgi:hypothetical protein